MRKIAHSQSVEECEETIKTLQNSSIWKKYHEFNKWFTRTWLKCTWRWVRAYMSKEFDTMVTTTNGVESLNKLLKYSFLPHSPDKTLSSLVKTLIEQYYPSAIAQYYEKNVKFTGINRKFNDKLPEFMHCRPTSFIKQCYKVYKAAELDFQDCSEEQLILSKNHELMIYDVKSAYGSAVYQVHWKKPFCSCPAFANFKPYPCKHFFILILMLKELTWDNLPTIYTNQSLFIADTHIPILNVPQPRNEDGFDITQLPDEASPNDDVSDDVTENLQNNNEVSSIRELPAQRSNSRKPILKLLSNKAEKIRSDMYLCHNTQILMEVSDMLDSCIELLDDNIPKEENIKLEAEDLPQKKVGRDRKDWHHRNRVGKKAQIYRTQYKVHVPISKLNTKKSSLETPAWGGSVQYGEGSLSLTNTCPIDNWLLYMRVSNNLYQEVLTNCKEHKLLEVYSLVLAKKYDEAKFKLAILNKLKINKHNINFFGNEMELFTRHVRFLTTYVNKSECDSKHCPQKSNSTTHEELPKLVNHQTNVELEIQKWFTESGFSKCGKLFKQKPEEYSSFYTSSKVVIDDG